MKFAAIVSLTDLSFLAGASIEFLAIIPLFWEKLRHLLIIFIREELSPIKSQQYVCNMNTNVPEHVSTELKSISKKVIFSVFCFLFFKHNVFSNFWQNCQIHFSVHLRLLKTKVKSKASSLPLIRSQWLVVLLIF